MNKKVGLPTFFDCAICGEECEETLDVCPKCNNTLSPKENLMVEYLIDKTKDKYKGDIEDSVIEAIINFIKSHLYGFILTISIVGVLVANVIDTDFYVRKVSNEPGNNTVVVENAYSGEQNSIKEVVDEYFYYGRNVDKKDNAKEKLEALKTAVSGTAGFHEVEEVNEVDSIQYEYSLIDPNCINPPTVVSYEFKADGYQVAEVIVVETMKKDSETKEGLFIVTLVNKEGKWSVNEAISSYSDPKLEYYVQDYLYVMGESICAVYSQNNANLEEVKPYLIPDKYKIASNIEISQVEDINTYYYVMDPSYDLISETSLVKQLKKKGYEILQAQLIKQKNDAMEEYVITFVNIDAMWYVAEIVSE